MAAIAIGQGSGRPGRGSWMSRSPKVHPGGGGENCAEECDSAVIHRVPPAAWRLDGKTVGADGKEAFDAGALQRPTARLPCSGNPGPPTSVTPKSSQCRTWGTLRPPRRLGRCLLHRASGRLRAECQEPLDGQYQGARHGRRRLRPRSRSLRRQLSEGRAALVLAPPVFCSGVPPPLSFGRTVSQPPPCTTPPPGAWSNSRLGCIRVTL